jgi:hypothetical protein
MSIGSHFEKTPGTSSTEITTKLISYYRPVEGGCGHFHFL